MEKNESILYIGKSENPWENLALEEYWMRNPMAEKAIFYLWQNQHTIVIGRNQNPWKECTLEIFESEGGRLARRLSGGGTVYHDLGNLNFSFIVDRDIYDPSKQFSVIGKTLNKFGLTVEKSGRNDMLLEGRKFSGNAFYFLGHKALHHGTILINTDMEKVSKYLNPSKEKLKSKGVSSVRSRVINLQEIDSTITVARLIPALIETFREVYQFPIREFDVEKEKDEAAYSNFYKKHASESWRYGKTPCFDYSLLNRFSWGEVEFLFHIQNACVVQTVIFSDSLFPDFIEQIEEILRDIPFRKKSIIDSLLNIKEVETETMITDLTEWIESMEF